MKNMFPMLIVLSCILFAPFTAKAHIADCHIDISDNYLENEFLGKTLDELTQTFEAKEFEIMSYGVEEIETRLNICGNYELVVGFDKDGLVRAVHSETSIFYLDVIDIFNVRLLDAKQMLADGELTWAWNEGREIFYRFNGSKLSLSYGHVEDAAVCLESLDKCSEAETIYPVKIFTYKLN